MVASEVAFVHADMLTAYGRGMDATWSGLLSGRSAISKVDRFDTGAFRSHKAGIVSGLTYHKGESLSEQMLAELLLEIEVPSGAQLFFATTKGEIECLEQSISQGLSNESSRNSSSSCSSNPTHLMQKVGAALGLDGATLISAACASSTSALARAASEIRAGRADAAVVVACDSVSEFVYSGFSSLMALDEDMARPFDKTRSGLSIGEAACVAVLMSAERAKRESRAPIGYMDGWGMSSDANHMTGPSRDGRGLSLAMEKAIRSAGASKSEVGSICAHGTGTLYNDSMEMKALRLVFGGHARPVYSVKGGLGHTMGAAGLLEAIITLESLRTQSAPPTVNLKEVDAEAEGWASGAAQAIGGRYALTTNSGFGGANAALLMRAA